MHTDIRELMCDLCYKMWQKDWVAANDGNLSALLPDGTLLCTPTGFSKSLIKPHMLVRIDREGNVLEAASGYRPSSEIKLHLRCYQARPDVAGVVHAHPPYATAYAAAGIALTDYSMTETVATLGQVPLAPYATPPPVKCRIRWHRICKTMMRCCSKTMARWPWGLIWCRLSTAWRRWNTMPRSACLCICWAARTKSPPKTCAI